VNEGFRAFWLLINIYHIIIQERESAREHAGKESTLPMAVLTQELLMHAERCMRHETVSKTIMLAVMRASLWTKSLTLQVFFTLD